VDGPVGADGALALTPSAAEFPNEKSHRPDTIKGWYERFDAAWRLAL
jgi:hypothetical protein